MKIEEQVLSREQMAHLVELGVDTSDASMCWMVDLEDGEEEVVVFNPIMLGYATCKLYPTYTIGDLIEKVSKLFNGFDFSEGKPKGMLYSCLCWMARNKKELIK